MVAAYNLYLGGYLPRVQPKNSVHNRSELKSKYKSIVSMNNANPLVMVKLSNDTQAYGLFVKEKSMELAESSQDAMDSSASDARETLQKMAEDFNALLKRSDEFGLENGKPSRPGGELRNIVARNASEISESGLEIDDDGFLKIPEDSKVNVPVNFVKALKNKAEEMSMNPMEYVEKKVYSYAHLCRNDIGSAYESSMYSGMLFNSYC